MISEAKTIPETYAPDRTITVDGQPTSANAPAYSMSAQKTSWVKICVDEVIQSFALVSKSPYR